MLTRLQAAMTSSVGNATSVRKQNIYLAGFVVGSWMVYKNLDDLPAPIQVFVHGAMRRGQPDIATTIPLSKHIAYKLDTWCLFRPSGFPSMPENSIVIMALPALPSIAFLLLRAPPPPPRASEACEVSDVILVE